MLMTMLFVENIFEEKKILNFNERKKSENREHPQVDASQNIFMMA